MDLPEHVATGLLASGTVSRAEDAPEAEESETQRLVDLVEVQNEYLEILLRKHPALKDVAPEAFAGSLDPVKPQDLEAIGEALGDPPTSNSVEAGTEVAEPNEEPYIELEQRDDLPAGNASRDTWADFALANGKTEDDLMGLNRDAIRELFVSAPAAE